MPSGWDLATEKLQRGFEARLMIVPTTVRDRIIGPITYNRICSTTSHHANGRQLEDLAHRRSS